MSAYDSSKRTQLEVNDIVNFQQEDIIRLAPDHASSPTQAVVNDGNNLTSLPEISDNSVSGMDLVSLPEPVQNSSAPNGVISGGIDAPAAPVSLNTLATYLNDQDAAGLDFWDEFGVSQSPFFNLTASGTNAKNGVLHYNVTNFSGVDSDGVSSARADMIRHALNVYEDILGINFVETTSTDTSVVDIFFYDNVPGRAFANFTQGGDGSIGYSWVQIASGWNGGTTAIGSYSFQTALHEIGHVLGLGHQGLYNAGSGSPTYQDAYWQNDSWQQTMMSYWSQSSNTDITADYARLIGPMAVDWLALENLYGSQGYGVASGTTTGDTTWGFNGTWYDWTPTSSGPIEGYSNSAYAGLSTLLSTNAVCIVDGGGTDTLDLSGFSNNTVIDVSNVSASSTTGSISSVAGLIGNLTIAVGTIIENVVGGAGDERILGNSAANRILGNAGNDTVFGYGGVDVLFGGTDNDRLVGGGGNDKLRGQSENDVLVGGGGRDNMNGGSGADRLIGSNGGDVLRGGADADKFIFNAVSHSTTGAGNFDKIKDFAQGTDVIKLSRIDADDFASGNQAFSFIGTTGFSGTAGELRYENRGSNTLILGDVDGDGSADLRILLNGTYTCSAADFIL